MGLGPRWNFLTPLISSFYLKEISENRFPVTYICFFFVSGLAFDSWDMDFYMDLFVKKLKRDPTSVELFDLAQSNSEHSRHWFFKVT